MTHDLTHDLRTRRTNASVPLAVRVRRAVAAIDTPLAIALGLTIALCAYGITARRLHPDAMAFLPLFPAGYWPFDPGWFEKPPLYPYCNYFLAVLPISLAAKIVHLDPTTTMLAKIVWSRVLLACALAGMAWIVFATARAAYGIVAARAVGIVLATSAGMVAFVHQLTSDVPVTFWMVVAFYFAAAIARDESRVRRGGVLRDYALAGLCTGLAAATKYNGAAVGSAIVAAHALRVAMDGDLRRWRRLLFDRDLIVGLAMVPIGFLIGNPYALLDHHKFAHDFSYNYMLAPVYEGQTGHSWCVFFLRIVEVVGVPAFVVFTVGALAATWVVVRERRLGGTAATFWTTAAVVAVYYAKFAPFARLETRFVLPIVPFWLLLSGPAWARARSTSAVTALVAALVAYNVVCDAYVGQRFLADPRLAVDDWIRADLTRASALEADVYALDVHELAMPRAVTMPFVTGRERLFERIFPDNRFINGGDDAHRRAEDMVAWYTPEALARRDPDYLVVDSLYYDRFVEPGVRRDLYPSIQRYFDDLLAERTPYRIVFDRRSPPTPSLVYPRAIDFLDNRATILAKRSGR